MYTELETYMISAVNKAMDQRDQRRKENAIFYSILCGVVFFTVFACGWAMK